MRAIQKILGPMALCAVACTFVCCDGGSSEIVIPNTDLSGLFENGDGIESDFENGIIEVPAGVDSLVIDDVSSLGGTNCYLTLDNDLIDPEIDWDSPVDDGTVLDLGGSDFVNIVVLDSNSQIVKVWQVVVREESSSSVKSSSSAKSSSSVKSSSSSKAKSSSSEKSSSSKKAESSSSSKKVESSSSEEAVSSSEEPAESSSSAEEPSSSSETPASSANVAVKLSELSVAKGTITVKDSFVYVELPYGTNLSKVELLPLDTVNDLRRPVEMEFADDEGTVGTYSVVAGVQLPGSNFSARDDFWATTSDAMATKKTAAAITVSSSANLEFDGGMATITTREVEGSLVIIDGSWKMAGGFYFSGEYAGTTALDIYQQGYTSGTPSTGDSYIANDMTFGKPFTARPTAFTVKYSYIHKANTSTQYPQKSLVYVMLVGKNGKVVATGAFSDDESVEMNTRTVKLSYGKDPFGLLDGDYAVAEGLSLGKGDEDVTSIHVMFASSAYAHVVSGGTAGNSGKYRGGENSALVLDDFKLEYLGE